MTKQIDPRGPQFTAAVTAVVLAVVLVTAPSAFATRAAGRAGGRCSGWVPRSASSTRRTRGCSGP